MSRGSRIATGVAALTATLLCIGPSAAQENVVGSEIYMTGCASCHGVSGRGDGEIAKFLTVKPADLTMISANNHGEFPFLKVFQYIDGRTLAVGAHGSSEMPIWGDVFTESLGAIGGPYGTELLVRARLVAVVEYIESLQGQ